MNSENKPENVPGDSDQEVTKLSESSSSEKSFLSESEVSSAVASGEQILSDTSDNKVGLALDESNASPGEASSESLESSGRPSVVSDDDSKSESSGSSSDQLSKTSVEGSQGELISELGRATEVRDGVKNKNNYQSKTATDEETNNEKIFANPFASNMEPGEKMLRTFLLLGLFPLPVIGWIIGLFSSLTIKKKKRIHKILTSILFLLTLLSVVAGIIVLGYFLVKNSKDADSTSDKKSNDKDKSKPVIPGPKVDVDVPGPKVQDVLPPEHRRVFDDINDMLGPDPRIAATLEVQTPGEYKVIPNVVRPKVIYNYEKPKLEYIPPKFLKPPVTVSKTEGKVSYDVFEYKHPSSKKEMVILMRGLHESWKSHEMFRFSEYVDHSIKVFNVTSTTEKLNLPKILTELKTPIAYKTNVVLIADFKDSDVTEYESTHSSMKIKRLLVITPTARCDPEVLPRGPNVDMIGILDKQINCPEKVNFPLMIVEDGVVKFTKKGSGLTDLKTYLPKIKVDCDHSVSSEKYTKMYLDKLYLAFRKFISISSETETDPTFLEVLCSKAK